MPRIFDNIDLPLLPTLRDTLKLSYRADFCVGYFNLRGWQKIDGLIEQYVGGEMACCRLLVGMPNLPSDEVHVAYTLSTSNQRIDNSTILRLKKRIATHFRQQLTIGAPTNQDEVALRRLSTQIKTGKLIVKLFLLHPLHAKLYLIHRHDPNTPIVGFLGSSRIAFIQSIERHVLRNFIYLYAIENSLDIPIGTQEADLLDTRNNDEDSDSIAATLFDTEIEDTEEVVSTLENHLLQAEESFRQRATQVYQEYQTHYKRRFKWLRSTLFQTEILKRDLLADAQALISVLQSQGVWHPNQDEKLAALIKLLQQTHPQDKVLIFTQFADTVLYLTDNLKASKMTQVAGVTGQAKDPTQLTARFSPVSNGKRDKVAPEQELRVLITTDVLSEGHNLQDCAIIVNYDLPWAIIRLIQRAGRVDRIGQKAEKILCYAQEMKGTIFVSEELLKAIDEIYRYPLRQSAIDIGEIKYLNGGLFLKHKIEQIYTNISIPDGAFENIFNLFSSYSWNLDDTPGGQDNEINPNVLGYIFDLTSFLSYLYLTQPVVPVHF